MNATRLDRMAAAGRVKARPCPLCYAPVEVAFGNVLKWDSQASYLGTVQDFWDWIGDRSI